MNNIFAWLDPWIATLVLAGLMGAAWGVGRWLARRAAVEPGNSLADKFGDASLALLSLLLSFTFAAALSRYDNRRAMLVADSNSIGDFYTCVSMLDDPVRTQLQGVVREYVDLRLSMSRLDESALDADLHQVQAMHARMTDLVTQAVRAGTPITVPLVQTLNALTSGHAARLAAFRVRLPPTVLLLLLLASLGSMLLMGQRRRPLERRHVPGALIFTVLVALAVFVILDLTQPTRGLIYVSQEPLQRLRDAIAK